jgi:hypothetical protein
MAALAKAFEDLRNVAGDAQVKLSARKIAQRAQIEAPTGVKSLMFGSAEMKKFPRIGEYQGSRSALLYG